MSRPHVWNSSVSFHRKRIWRPAGWEWINDVSRAGRHPQILFLIPGLAFDDTLSRIGYGGGFYDAYLDQMRRMKNADVNTVAVAFSCQLFQETFPVAEHDIRPQMLITK